MQTVKCIIAALLMSVNSAAAAAPCAGFVDVEDDSPFCGSVEWIKNREVTKGCTADAYCPNDYVTRAQLAIFLQRQVKATGLRSVFDGTGKLMGGYETGVASSPPCTGPSFPASTRGTRVRVLGTR